MLYAKNSFSLQTLTVPNKKGLEMIPNVPGLLSYRADKKQLYVNEGSKWQELSNEPEVRLSSFNEYSKKLNKLIRNILITLR